MGESSRLAIPAMARHPLAPPDNFTTLALIGQAAVTDEFPFQEAMSRPRPRKKASSAQVKRIFGFMAPCASIAQMSLHCRGKGESRGRTLSGPRTHIANEFTD